MTFDNLGAAILFVSHSLCTVFGLLWLKVSLSQLEKFSIANLIDLFTLKLFFGLFLYIAAFLLSLVILHKFPLGVSVSIMMPLSLTTATFVGYVFLNENISAQSLVGLTLILVGIFTIYIERHSVI